MGKCTECIHSRKIEDNVYRCDAERFDIEEFTCFVQKENTKND